VIGRLHDARSEVWVTVTGPGEARRAVDAGADALVVQGAEAGGHRASFRDDPAEDVTGGIGLLSLLQLVRAQAEVPLVATGGIATGAAIAAVLVAGAAAAVGHGVPELPGSRHGGGAPPGACRQRPDRHDPGLHRPAGPRNPQPVPGPAQHCRAGRLPPSSTT
jgi:hypothetical protein